MPLILEGTVNGMRAVTGVIEQGKNKGQFWHFVSLEICDPRFGQVYSCQLRQSEKDLFAKFVKLEKAKENGQDVEKASLLQDWSGHNVKVLVKGISAGSRLVEDKETGRSEAVLLTRIYVAGLKDEGLPKTDDF